MPRPFYLSPRRHGSRAADVTVVAQAGQETLSAILLAAGAVAVADGTADPCERQALLAFMRDRGLLARYGRAAILSGYDAAVQQAGGKDLADTINDLAPLRRVAHTQTAALVAQAAAHVALADGVQWPQETALLGVIGERLGTRAMGEAA